MPSVTSEVTSALCRTARCPPEAMTEIQIAPARGMKIVATSSNGIESKAKNSRRLFLVRKGRESRPDDQRDNQHDNTPQHRERVELHHPGLQWAQRRGKRAGNSSN